MLSYTLVICIKCEYNMHTQAVSTSLSKYICMFTLNRVCFVIMVCKSTAACFFLMALLWFGVWQICQQSFYVGQLKMGSKSF